MSDPKFRGGAFSVSKNGAETFAMHNAEVVARYHENEAVVPREPLARPTDPARFYGPKLKIERSKRHIRELETLAREFAEKGAYALTHEIDPETGENVFRILVNESIPAEASAIIGDAVHNARAALDFLVCDLARANGEVPDQNGGFPIKREAKRLRPGASSKIKGVSASAERIINRVKGCERLNGPLFDLNILDNFDKHNTIVTVAAATVQITAKVGVPGIFLGPEGTICIGGGVTPLMLNAGTPSTFNRVFPLENNIEVHRSPGGFNEEILVAVDIAFGKTQVIQIEGKPVIEALKYLTGLVERLIGIFERSCF